MKTPPAPKKVTAKPESGETGVVEEVAELARVLRDNDLSEIEIDRTGIRITLRRSMTVAAPAAVQHTVHVPIAAPAAIAAAAPVAAAPAAAAPVAAAPAAAPAAPAAAGHPAIYITSPFVGTFYRQPSPDAPSFVDVGSKVRKGQVLCIIEAMKLMNEIEAEVDGTIVACLAENGQPVEYGEPLFQIRS
jgi:acetyl-CoA carboxylase biotin carboxyl carrier protein